jgi:hypothetical protein
LRKLSSPLLRFDGVDVGFGAGVDVELRDAAVAAFLACFCILE